MEKKSKIAVEKFKNGYNCCQAVLCSYCEEFGISEKDAFRITEGMGGGIGGMGETCGAVLGMCLTISLSNSAGNMELPKLTKMDTYRKIQEASKAFQEKNGSLDCRDLKGPDGPQPLQSCIRCVEDAASWLDENYFV